MIKYLAEKPREALISCGALNAVLAYVLLFAASSLVYADEYKVKRVVDGDTIELEEIGKVRLIGVDTPETKHPRKPVECFGPEASKFTKKMMEGKVARIKYGKKKTGKYGRVLGYIYLLDGTFLNAEIIKQGYGKAYLKYPFKYSQEFKEYEEVAQSHGKGLWTACKKP